MSGVLKVSFLEIRCTFCLGCQKMYVVKTGMLDFPHVLRCDNHRCKLMEKHCDKQDCVSCNFRNGSGKTVVTTATIKDGKL